MGFGSGIHAECKVAMVYLPWKGSWHFSLLRKLNNVSVNYKTVYITIASQEVTQASSKLGSTLSLFPSHQAHDPVCLCNPFFAGGSRGPNTGAGVHGVGCGTRDGCLSLLLCVPQVGRAALAPGHPWRAGCAACMIISTGRVAHTEALSVRFLQHGHPSLRLGAMRGLGFHLRAFF